MRSIDQNHEAYTDDFTKENKFGLTKMDKLEEISTGQNSQLKIF